MALAGYKTFTIDDLVRIALGTGEFTNERLHVLQNIFLILLQKLNCHNETVKIKGLAAKCLQEQLNNCPNICQCKFQFENIKSFENKYHLLDELERKTQEIGSKLKKHFEQIRSRNKTTIFAANKWRIYSNPTEDLGAPCLKENRKYWFLLESSVFNNELRRRAVPQVVSKVEEFENKIETMQKQLLEITQIADATTDKLQQVECIIKDTEDLRSFISVGEKDFRDAIAEVDEMLSCKLHRVTVPALKKYLEKCFENANRQLNVLQLVGKKCPSTKPLLIEDKKTCLSCGHHRSLKDIKKLKHLKSIDENIKCTCCNLLKDPPILEKIYRPQNPDLTEKVNRLNSPACDSTSTNIVACRP